MTNTKENGSAGIVAGRYRHFKGREYRIYCVATDYAGCNYVLYQQLYGEHLFWIRPYEMFDDEVGSGVSGSPRFHLLERMDSADSMRELADLARRQPICATNSEDGRRYHVVEIGTSANTVRVHPAESRCASGFSRRA